MAAVQEESGKNGDHVIESLSPAEKESPGEKKQRQAAKFPPGVWERAKQGWQTAYHHVHGIDYAWDGRDWTALSKILALVKADLDRFAEIARAWLRETEVGRARGHWLYELAGQINTIREKIAKGRVGHANHKSKPTSEQRGHFPEPERELPEFGEAPARR
jgi:hypothetical protein